MFSSTKFSWFAVLVLISSSKPTLQSFEPLESCKSRLTGHALFLAGGMDLYG